MKSAVFFILVLIIHSGCQEIYEPDVNTDLSVLAVEGLVTDAAETYYIRLHMAKPFDSSGMLSPVTGAEVYVTDDLLHTYPFKETIKGRYDSDSGVFKAITGRKYTLSVVTKDNLKYESTEEELIPNENLDSIYGQVTTKKYYWKNHYGDYVYNEYRGIETYIDFPVNPGESSVFKFNCALLYEYTINNNGKTIYSWKIFDLNESINITEGKIKDNIQEIIAHPLPFFPTSKSWYALDEEIGEGPYTVTHWILILNQYRLNNDASDFNKRMKEMLEAEGKLFDPIAVQLNGNIRCTTDPKKLVLGFFEVSSKATLTYVASPDWLSGKVSYVKKHNLKNVPKSGSQEKYPPDFWIR